MKQSVTTKKIFSNTFTIFIHLSCFIAISLSQHHGHETRDLDFCYNTKVNFFHHIIISPSSAQQSYDSVDRYMEETALAVIPYETPILAAFHEKDKTVTVGSQHYHIRQDWHNMGVAAVVWDSAVVLGEYLIQQIGNMAGKRVVELGAGTGLAGLVAASLGGEVVLTDREVALPTLKENVELNQDKISHGSAAVEVLDWGDHQIFVQNHDTMDYVLGADIVYIEDSFPALRTTLLSLCSTEKTVGLLASKIRYQKDVQFFDSLTTDFNVEEKYYDTKSDIHIYSIVRKNMN